MNSDLKPVLGFDFGMKYIGVATGQYFTRTASPLGIIHMRGGAPDWPAIDRMIQEWRPQALIVGLPLTEDGEIQAITLCAKRFGNRLNAKFKLPVHFIDEHLTSWEAKRSLKIGAHPSKKQINQANALSAVVILEDWLNQVPSIS